MLNLLSEVNILSYLKPEPLTKSISLSSKPSKMSTSPLLNLSRGQPPSISLSRYGIVDFAHGDTMRMWKSDIDGKQE